MTQGRCGLILRPDGTLFGGDVRLLDTRVTNLRELLADLASPGLCLVLGAGASYGVVPNSTPNIAALARELRDAGRDAGRLPAQMRSELEDPYVRFVADLLAMQPSTASWGGLLATVWPPPMRLGIEDENDYGLTALPDVPTHAEARVIFHELWKPKGKVPKALTRIYDVLESWDGIIVSYNYDRIATKQTRFEVIAPHGQRSVQVEDPRRWAEIKQLARHGVAIPTDMHLLVPEDDTVPTRADYEKMLWAFRRARCVAFIGYGFGAGADHHSYDDFGRNLAARARVHVLSPRPDNEDLRKQVQYALRGRPPRFRVFGQPFRWQSFASAVLSVLKARRATHVRHALPHAAEIAIAHDRM